MSASDYRRHPAYERGYQAGLYSRPRKGRTDAYDAGYDAGIDTANTFLANGFMREGGSFVIKLPPLTAAQLKALGKS